MPRPEVSVIIPVYNHERFIGECVESVLAQDFPSLEVIVVDDGSTDGTPDILRYYRNEIRYIRQENRGCAAALNVGVKAARGDYVAWLSSDDVFLPGKIRAQMDVFREREEVVLVYTDFRIIDSEGRRLQDVLIDYGEEGIYLFSLLSANIINGSSVLMRKKAVESLGGFDETLPVDVDGDMWFRMLAAGMKFAHVPEILLLYRFHETNLSRDVKRMHFWKDKVRARSIEAAPVENMFGDYVEREGFTPSKGYLVLADLMMKGGFLQASKAAFRKAEEFAHEFSGI